MQTNEIDKKSFKQIFGHTLATLVSGLINTKNKEENQIIVKNIKQNKEKLFEQKRNIGWSNLRVDLKYTIDLILDFNETIRLDVVWKHKH